jgi:putative hemolysin
MDWLPWLVAALLGLVLSGLFSGAETGVYSLNRVRLRVRSEQGAPRARRLARLMERPDEIVITVLVGTNLADYICSISIAALVMLAGAPLHLSDLYAAAIGTPLVLVFGGIIPKDIFQRHADRLMYALSGPLLVCRQATRMVGASWLLRTVPRLILGALRHGGGQGDADLLPRVRMQRLLHEGAARGGLTRFQRDTIERILSLSRVSVGRVMVPLARAAVVPEHIARDDFLRIARMAHFSRLPVWRDHPASMIGIVTIFSVLTDPQQRPIAAHVRPAVVLRADETVPAALLKLQQSHEFMAIVTDRRGRCVGLLTLKDLVEEIVGDLEAW